MPRAHKTYTLAVETGFPAGGSGLQRAAHLTAIGGPIGFIPWVPATFASAFVALACWLGQPAWLSVAAISAGLLLVGAPCASVSERLLGSHDPRNVVIDEFAGQLLTFLFVVPTDWRLAGAGFLLFRLFDVIKPFPARHAEDLPGGWGVMADDLVAGIYAAIALYLLHPFLR